MKKVSLIIPVYNVVHYINDSFYSALNQTYKNIEYIIVDDCGLDESMRVVNTIINNHARKKDIFVLSHEVNKGIGEARNTGIRFATGEYIYFMDSDDLMTPDCIECLVNLIEEKNVDVVVGSYEVHENMTVISRVYGGTFYTEDIILNYFKEKKWDCLCWNILVKRNIVYQNRIYFPKLSYSEDVCFLFNLYTSIDSIALTPHITYKYIRRAGSITSTKIDLLKMRDAFAAYQIMYCYLKSFQQCKQYALLANYLNNNRLYLLGSLLNEKECHIKDLYFSFAPLLNFKDLYFSKLSIKDKCKHAVFLLPNSLKIFILNYFLRFKS